MSQISRVVSRRPSALKGSLLASASAGVVGVSFADGNLPETMVKDGKTLNIQHWTKYSIDPTTGMATVTAKNGQVFALNPSEYAVVQNHIYFNDSHLGLLGLAALSPSPTVDETSTVLAQATAMPAPLVATPYVSPSTTYANTLVSRSTTTDLARSRYEPTELELTPDETGTESNGDGSGGGLLWLGLGGLALAGLVGGAVLAQNAGWFSGFGANRAPTANDSDVTGQEDQSLALSSDDFMVADKDKDDAVESVTITTLPTKGTLLLNGTAVTVDQVLSPEDLDNLTYQAPADANGQAYDGFTYTAYDGELHSDPATMTIHIDPVNDAPTAHSATISGDEDLAIAIGAEAFQVADIDGDAVTIVIHTLPAQGSLLLNGVAVAEGQEIAQSSLGGLTFIPAANANGDGYASFTYCAFDGQLTSEPATINIDINPVNDAPIAQPAEATGDEDTTFTVGQDAFNVTDPDGDDVSVVIHTLPGTGTLALNAVPVTQGQTIAYSDLAGLTYTPQGDAFGDGIASFTYCATDGELTSAPQTVSLNVNAVNDAPVFNPMDALPTFQCVGAAGSDTIDIDLAPYFHDVDGDDVAISIHSGLPDGVALVDGALVGTPTEHGDHYIVVSGTDGIETVSGLIVLSVALDNSDYENGFGSGQETEIDGSSCDDTLEFGDQTASGEDSELDVTTGNGDDTMVFGREASQNGGVTNLDMGDGNDQLTFGDEAASDDGTLIIGMGDDDDVVIFGDNAALDNGQILLDTGAGNDHVTLGEDAAHDNGHINISLGTGADTIHIGAYTEDDHGELRIDLGGDNDEDSVVISGDVGSVVISHWDQNEDARVDVDNPLDWSVSETSAQSISFTDGTGTILFEGTYTSTDAGDFFQ